MKILLVLTLALILSCSDNRSTNSDIDVIETDSSPYHIQYLDPNVPENHEDIEGYRVVFYDYFDGNELNDIAWDRHPWWGKEHSGNGSTMYYGSDNISVEDGFLKIKVDELPDQSILEPPYDNPYTWPGRLDHTSGSINTHQFFNFTYGIVKFRVKVAAGMGLWPAIWLIVPRDYTIINNTWGPEIDILEMSDLTSVNKIGIPRIMGGYLYWTDKDNMEPKKTIYENVDENLFYDFTNKFHDYELHWLKDELIFYFNDIEILRVDRSDLPSSSPPHSDWIPNVPMYLMINVAVGAHWMNENELNYSLNNYPINDAMVVDYIKVYQKID